MGTITQVTPTRSRISTTSSCIRHAAFYPARPSAHRAVIVSGFGKASGQGHTLSLTTGKLMRLRLANSCMCTRPSISWTRLEFPLSVVCPVSGQKRCSVPRHMRKQRVRLKHHIDGAQVRRTCDKSTPSSIICPAEGCSKLPAYAAAWTCHSRMRPAARRFTFVDGQADIIHRMLTIVGLVRLRISNSGVSALRVFACGQG